MSKRYIRQRVDNVILHILKVVAPLIKSDEHYIKNELLCFYA